LALVALSPLLIVVALIIKLADGGPILFRQSRVGLGGKPFDILKFRSMRVDGCDFSGAKQTKAGDDRLTRVGSFLRRTSIDELPQLLNIVIGDMSLVGPRPHVQGQLAAHRPYIELVPYYDSRYLMRPGLTGWAQCNGLRGPTDDAHLARARIEHDIAYIQNFSLFLDVRIVLRTLVHEFLTGSGL
jgi:lipopolysaccharide/colanic/teichoic acid biosynthesis glycosyltransferase